jgi:hypothetical protein
MATFTSTRAAATYPVAKSVGAGALSCAWGSIEVAANPVAADIYQICRVPAGAVVVGGYIFGDDMDTNASETLDLDFGWEANADEVADPDGLGNFGVMATDTVAGIKPEAGYQYSLGGVLIVTGPKAFTAETILSFTTVATAATFAAGTLGAVVYYLNP